MREAYRPEHQRKKKYAGIEGVEERRFVLLLGTAMLRFPVPSTILAMLTKPSPPANRNTVKRQVHGGDLARVATTPGSYTGEWLDRSTGHTPLPSPVRPEPDSLWTRLPGEALLNRLRSAAADAYGALSLDTVVAASGSQALINWLPRLRAPGHVAILGPTYGEHAATWASAGHMVEMTTTADELLRIARDVAVVTCPNNPDGRIVPRELLLPLAERLGAQGGWLVVDEAFADVTPEISLVSEVLRPGLIVLRSFGKFFGLAGLRVGFAFAKPTLAVEIEEAIGPWAVRGPAAWIASKALGDRDWIASTRQHLSNAEKRLDQLFREVGLGIVGGTSLYRLVESPDAAQIYAALLRDGIYVRHFPDYPRWLRFGLPPDEAGWRRLSQTLCAETKSFEISQDGVL